MRHCIITGAYGLVGSNFVFPDDWKVSRVKFDDLTGLEPADYIIHGAGYGQPHKFKQHALDTIRVNTETTQELFKLLKPGGRFLYISTSEIYSGAQAPYLESDIGTTTPQHPRACYIEAKRCGETICTIHRNAGVNVKIARLSLAYGPGTRKGDTRVLPSFIEQALTTGIISLKDSGDAHRTYCYVADATEMMMSILLYGKEFVYNVGGFSTITILELAQKISSLVGATVSLGPVNGSDAPENVELILTRFINEFPKNKWVSLDEGLRKTIEWQRSL